MKLTRLTLTILFILLFSSCRLPEQPKPLSLHQQNPHYFLFRGEPVILIGSTEHYGAVMNLDFDYMPYLDELAASGLNITRTFSGAYVEPADAFGIKKNTMSPAQERFICPWSRSKEPGYANGGNKFDLSAWDEVYFTRLKDFVAEAGQRNIVVELDLFSNYYDSVQWKLSPLNILNNINRIGNFKDHKEVLSLKHTDLLKVQEEMVRKIINELKEFDNLYYEVCNEPYFGDTLALREWEGHMTGVVAEAEKNFVYKHLISNNVKNFKKHIPEPREHVSIYNFHYAEPPVTVPLNYHLNLPLGDNETGFRGIEGTIYRIEAWRFLLAGGAIFNHLDYSFTTENEDGTNIIQKGEPGGGGKILRQHFGILARFMKALNFINMKPIGDDVVKRGTDGVSVEGLVEEGKVWALYLSVKDSVSISSFLEVNMPEGSYNLIWSDTKTGAETSESHKSHPGGWLKIKTPEFLNDIAVCIRKTN